MTPTPNQLPSVRIDDYANEIRFIDPQHLFTTTTYNEKLAVKMICKILDEQHLKQIELEERMARLENICICPNDLPPNVVSTNCLKHGLKLLT